MTENRGQSSGFTKALGWQRHSGVHTGNRGSQVEGDVHPTLALTVSSVALMPPIGDPRKTMWLGSEGEGGKRGQN